MHTSSLTHALPRGVGLFPLIACLCFACGADGLPAKPAVPPDIVILLTDGLREGTGPLHEGAEAFRDALHLPGLVTFSAAYTSSLESHVALGALLTGRYPSAIPLCGLPDAATTGGTLPWCATLPSHTRTLPEVLGLYGYESAFFGPGARGEGGLLRGFNEVHLDRPAAPGTEGTSRGEDVARWWVASAGSPRLLVVEAPLDLDELLPSIRATDEGAYALAWSQERRSPKPSSDPERYHAAFGGVVSDEAGLDEDYAALCAEAGQAAQALLLAVPPAEARERWVVTTSLRGTSLNEWSGTDHPEQLVPGGAELLLERTAHVPLDLYVPGGDAVEVERPVGLVDLLPTLLAVGGAVPEADIAGVDLLDEPEGPTVAYAEFGDMLLLRRESDLLVFRSEHHGTSSLSPELTGDLLGDFQPGGRLTLRRSDVTNDPLQRENLYGAAPERDVDLLATLRALRAGPGAPPEGALTPERTRALQALRAQGYW